MTKQQINWASQHDWFLKPDEDGKGVIVRNDESPNAGHMTAALYFSDFKKLKAWAGY